MPDVAVEVAGLRKAYGTLVAVDHVSFTVGRGEILGYLGPNGAGKSTTIKMLVGMLKPDGGTARVGGADVALDPLGVKRRIGYVPESGALYEGLSAFEFLQMVGRLHEMGDDAVDERIDALMTLFKLREQLFDRMTSYSKGMKQKVVIAAALMHDPDVVLLDEPLNGLDVHTTMQVKDLIKDLAGRGKTIIYSSHILDVVEKVCDRIIILDRGRVVVDDTLANVLARSEDSSLEGVFRSLTPQ